MLGVTGFGPNLSVASGNQCVRAESLLPLELEAAFPKPVFNLDPHSCLAANASGEPVPQPGKPSDTDILPNALMSSQKSSGPWRRADGPLDSALGLGRRLLFRLVSLRSKNQVRLGCLIRS